ncbi:MAG: hypothetical protein FDZ70_01655 [Actinobacteria bacterium]|nr:MAG: hypothetical protein FDZ70_01655 [Actinomycetota bacterium]
MSARKRADSVSGVPNFGATVRRDRLLKMVSSLGVDLLLLSAPSGYGKSVLAAQIATELFDEAIWISATELPPTPKALYAVVARRLGADVVELQGEGTATSACSEDELITLVGNAVRGARRGSLCVVVDDTSLPCRADLQRLAAALRRPAPERVLLVVTSRMMGDDSAAASCCRLGPADLRFGVREAAALLVALDCEAPPSGVIEPLVSATGGQPALLAVVARHTHQHDWRGSPTIPNCDDVRLLLIRLGTQGMDALEREALHVAALMGSGLCADVAEMVGHESRHVLASVGERVPLLHVEPAHVGGTFSVHDLAQEVYASRAYVREARITRAFDEQVVSRLVMRGRHARALELMTKRESTAPIAAFVAAHGSRLIAEGHGATVASVLDILGPSEAMQTRVLLVAAQVDEEKQQLESTLRKAMAAHRLAAEEGDVQTADEALLLCARMQVNRGHFGEAAALLERLFASGESGLQVNTWALTLGVGAVAAALVGNPETAAQRVRDARQQLAVSQCATSEIGARFANLVAFSLVAGTGDFASAIRVLKSALSSVPTSASTREYLRGNLATCLMEVGRMNESRRVYEAIAEQCRRDCGQTPSPTFWSAEAVLLFDEGKSQEALALAARSLDECARLGDRASVCDNQMCTTVLQMAVGDHDSALAHAEESFEQAVELGIPVLAERASALMRAALLAMGDVDAARHVVSAGRWAREHGASHVALIADLVLAEIARIEGDHAAAVAHALASADYLLSGNANWAASMYIRTFPSLLGAIAAALGSERVPIRMLRLLRPEHLALSMPLAREFLTPEQLSTLARRARFDARALPAAPTTAPGAAAGALPAADHLRVRLLGGLEVTTPTGVVSEKAWCKRKARLLFAMLVVRRGRDVAREVVYERLWPDLPEGRARNNFYVTWSAMKAALVPGSTRGVAFPWFENASGICRVKPEAVRTDLDEFDEVLLAARHAVDDGVNAAAFECYERLADIYRGELLPGDLYDDWFTAVRDDYRHQFGAAMAEASALAEKLDDPARALRFARAGLAQDPWREDLYQSALRHQIATGQRSAAIETYFACRSKLVEDLGLDPSRETVKLYEQVLAMEDDAPLLS